MRRLSLFSVGFLTATAFAGARRPPLPLEPVTAVSDGRSFRGVALVQVEGQPCLSLRDVSRLTGLRLSWRRLSREVSLVRDGKSLSFTLDASSAVVDGRTLSLASPVRWWTGQVYVPLSFFLTPDFRSFAGAEVAWEPQQKILAVTPTPDISSPHFTARPDRTRVSFDVAPRVEYRVLKDVQGVLVLRFFGGRSGSRERLDVQDPLLTAVDILPRSHATDVVLSFGAAAGEPRVFLEEGPRRVTVDVARRDGAAPAPVASSDGAEPLPADPALPLDEPVPALLPVLAPVPVPQVSAPSPAVAALSPVHVIVVDAGHGGRDVGAVGRRGTLEKDVNLLVAKAVAKALAAEGRYEVHLTRETDEFVGLNERAKFANDLKADLFISFHCNAALSPRSTGFEVYFLSEKATDDAAAAVARRENASLELEGAGDKMQAKVDQVLWSLAKVQDLNESSEVAALIQKHVDGGMGVPIRGVKQAGFYVLKWARMPAVLVESAFITNPQEEKILTSSRYPQTIVSAVVQGVRDYEKRKVQARLGRGGAGGS